MKMLKKALIIGLISILLISTFAVLTSAEERSYRSWEELELNPEGWLDEVVFIPEGDRAKVVDMMIKGDAHAYFIDISDPELFRKVRESPELAYNFSYGLYYELTFNPVGPIYGQEEFNPFSNPRIREAINYIVDRDYIADEIMGGLAVPKYVPLAKGLPEYQRHKDFITGLEEKYSYDFEKGKSIIFEEMEKMGAKLVDGKWYYNDKPVVIKFIIRTEDARKDIGDYVADQLEALGFTVERMYMTSKEASRYWIAGDPAEGKWTLYTGGWITTAVSRDDSDNFDFFYTPRGLPVPLWQAYKPAPEFDEVSRRLAEKDFKTVEERNELMRRALELCLKDSVRVWLVDQTAPFVRRKEVRLVTDLAGGYAVPIWPFTARFEDRVGGSLRIANSEVIVDPWNPVAGSDWTYDMVIIYATTAPDFATHPVSGLQVPIRVKSAAAFVKTGIPTTSNPEETGDWLNTTFIPAVLVPADAWYAWDPVEQRWITAGEAGVRAALARVRVNFGDIVGKLRYHDGSTFNIADFLLPYILNFERANNASPLYDEGWIPGFTTWRQQFVALKIVSEKPFVVDVWVNYTALDVEYIVDFAVIWGDMPWHVYTIGILAETEQKLAFSSDKAAKLEVDWMNYIGGPSLKILEEMLNKAEETGYIPFEKFLGKYITKEQAKEAYSLLRKWYNEHGHFWVGAGPYYLDRVDIVAHTALLKSAKYLFGE